MGKRSELITPPFTLPKSVAAIDVTVEGKGKIEEEELDIKLVPKIPEITRAATVTPMPLMRIIEIARFLSF
jgi:hypothetical protein